MNYRGCQLNQLWVVNFKCYHLPYCTLDYQNVDGCIVKKIKGMCADLKPGPFLTYLAPWAQ